MTILAETPLGDAPAGRGYTHRGRWLAAAIVLLAVSFVGGLVIGSRDLPLSALWAVALGAGDVETTAILFEQRIPRTVIAVMGGAALAVAGVLIQGHTRNPLADPGLLGVTAGSSLCVVVAIAFFGASTPAGYLWFAFAGAAIAAIVVTTVGRLAGGRRDSSPATLVLAGTAVSAILSAVSGVILLLSSSTLDLFRFWTVGSLSGVRDLSVLLPAFACIVVGLVVAIGHSSTLDALSMGDDTARSLGRNLGTSRGVGLTAVTLLVGGAVACCGSLGFVGLIAPHAVRAMVGPGHRWLVPFSAVVGGILVVIADIIGRVVLHPTELPVGVVLAMVGTPFFLFMVVRIRKARA